MTDLTKRSVYLLALMLTGLLLLAACVAPVATPADESGTTDTGEKSRLIVAQTVDLSGMEPSQVTSRAEANLFGHLYATLFEITDSGELVPYLATSYVLSEDGKELTFTLNEGLT